ncbi:MAG: cyclohexanecarboxylate-CoA ligase [Acidimicrobiales bacterium]|nr:MAG: cyclohexanecarboxylate-CoA ligase [Acidimicrobiales bacterium]
MTSVGRDLPDTLWALVEHGAATWPGAPMLRSRQGDGATFAEYQDRAERMAAGLAAHGVEAGDVVSWILPTWVDTVVMASALARLGAVQNPIIAIYRDREVGFCCRQAGSTLLITPGEFGGYDFAAMGERVAADIDGLDHLVVAPGQFPDGDPATLDAPVHPGPTDVRWLTYTSGTTADPKGARHTDQTVGAVPVALAARLDVRAGDRYSLTFPFPHIGGIALLYMAFQTGCTHLMDETVDPVETVHFLSEHDCTHAGTGTPFYLMYLAAQAALPEGQRLFPSLKVCPGGGAPIPPAIHHRLVSELGGVGVASGWGLTETPVLTNGDIRDPDEKLATTEGRAMPGVDLIAVAEDGTVCARGVEGELRAKGPQVMLGYVDAALDADAFDADGYYRTGDLGIIDEEGYVVITGRLKDVIIRNGENISAKEVEDLLFAHEGVADVAVVGLPDERTGERVCAVVVAADAAAELTVGGLGASLRDAGLRTQALPERVEVVDALPRNPAGKVLKRELQERFG